MSRLSDLLRQVERSDPSLAEDLRSEVKALSERRQFGLNFERHTPETVELPGRPIRRGDKVRLLRPRGSVEAGDDRIWFVRRVVGDTADLVGTAVDEPEQRREPVADLVVVAEFRDPIYPGLVSTGRVVRGGDQPFHTVINGENFHALEALLYTHEGKVDAIYIDPPYNTGARDWKYNNDYVDGEDIYRHSKWLAFMERRLKLAKRLLDPENSVLIVTIDEKEYLRLGLLLQQTFAGAGIQMATSVIAPAGQPRGNQMYRVDEYIFVVYLGAASAAGGIDDMLGPRTERDSASDQPVSWENLVRRGTSARRVDRENQFYPIVVERATKRIVEVGEPLLPLTAARDDIVPPDGCDLVWPIRTDGSEGRWRVSSEGVRRLLERGFVRVGRRSRSGQWTLSYVLRSDVQRVDRGEIVVEGLDEHGVAVLRRTAASVGVVRPKTVWNRESHNAGNYGSALLRNLIPRRHFDFPKSLYAVEDALRFFVADNPDAIVLDFFAGSGTTAHAVMRLNKQDGGRRQCISVTNNEVSADEQTALRKQGLRPGDPEWEQHGICDFITKPRIEAAITGRTPEGEPITGDYKFTDEFPMSDGFEANAEFFTLTYEAPRTVAHHKAFAAIAPLLWLRAGARGRRIDEPTTTFDIADTYGVLFNVDATAGFVKALGAGVRLAYVVTDDERAFQLVCAELPERVEPVRLYESYLTSFAIGVRE